MITPAGHRQGDGLRHRPRRLRLRRDDDLDRRRHRHRAVPLPRAGPRRGRRRPLRRLLDRLPALRAGHRRARRSPATPRWPSPTSTCARTRGSPSSINPEVPPELDAILLKAMSKNPANRYQSAAEMRSDLLRAARRPAGRGHAGDGRRREDHHPRPPPRRGYGYGDDDAGTTTTRPPGAASAGSSRSSRGRRPAAGRRRRRGRHRAQRRQRRPRPRRRSPCPRWSARPRPPPTAAIAERRAQGRHGDARRPAPSDQGQVLSSDPAGGAKVDEGTTVEPGGRRRPDTVAVPNVVGLTEDARPSDAGAGRVHRQRQHRPGRQPRGRGHRRRRRPGARAARPPPDTAITLRCPPARIKCPTSRARPRPTRAAC